MTPRQKRKLIRRYDRVMKILHKEKKPGWEGAYRFAMKRIGEIARAE